MVEACAKNGTHYVDSTGEIPWVKDIIEKYHDTAHENGAIVRTSPEHANITMGFDCLRLPR